MPKQHCSNCGAMQKPGDTFCQKCGAPVQTVNSSNESKGHAKLIIIAIVCVVVIIGVAINFIVRHYSTDTSEPEASVESVAETLADYLDLGERCLRDGDYREAILAYTSAIEIDSKNVEAYIGRADAYASLKEYENAVSDYEQALKFEDSSAELYIKLAEAYVSLGDFDKAIEALRRGLEKLPGDAGLQTMLDTLTKNETESEPETTPEAAVVAQLERLPVIEFSIDGIVLGETDLSVAKSKYSSRSDYMSNLMGDNEEHNTDDSVYSMPYLDDADPGNDMEFGYLFVQPVGGGSIQTMSSTSADLLCLGKYRAGDDASILLNDFFGLNDVSNLTEGENIFYDSGDSKMVLNKWSADFYQLTCNIGENHLRINVSDSKIHGFNLYTDNSSWNR